MKTKTKPTPRARRMWANYYPENPARPILHYSRKDAEYCVAFGAAHAAVPVAVIPLDNPEALVARAAEAFYELEHEGYCERRRVDYSYMRAALTAIGVLPKSKGGRK